MRPVGRMDRAQARPTAAFHRAQVDRYRPTGAVLSWLGKAVDARARAGANVLVASNPLLSHLVAGSLSRAGLERRGEIVRLVMTMRGGDRPKAAHVEFTDVSVMARSMWEPWLMFRKPIDGRVQDNLRRWGTGGFRRILATRPFGDVIESAPTRASERKLAPHPSLKPQAFVRQLVRRVLPLGQGVVLDPSRVPVQHFLQPRRSATRAIAPQFGNALCMQRSSPRSEFPSRVLAEVVDANFAQIHLGKPEWRPFDGGLKGVVNRVGEACGQPIREHTGHDRGPPRVIESVSDHCHKARSLACWFK